jgi:NAD+ kinase
VFDTIGIIGRRDDDKAAARVLELSEYLQRRSRQVLLDEESTGAVTPSQFEKAQFETVPRQRLGETCDLVIVLAGDGTLLGAARTLVDFDVPLLGVNLGRLGFLTDISPAEMLERMDEILDGQYFEDRRYLLAASVEGDDGPPQLALNEVVAHKLNLARLIEIETFIDGRLMSRQRCDGMVVATPTGSTAYALSGGGPIVQPDLEAMVLVPIAPHTLTSRPVVLSASCSVEMRVQIEYDGDVQMTCDGQVGRNLSVGDRLHIKRHDRELRLIHPDKHDYFATLRTKLYWGRET